MLGTITFYDRIKGFGFITPDAPEYPNFFVHCSHIVGNKHLRYLVVGQRVEFDPVGIDIKPAAQHVRKLPTRQVSPAVAVAEAKVRS